MNNEIITKKCSVCLDNENENKKFVINLFGVDICQDCYSFFAKIFLEGKRQLKTSKYEYVPCLIKFSRESNFFKFIKEFRK